MPQDNREQHYIWISVAETSADCHGAKLIDSLLDLEPGLELIGMGGPEMRARAFQAFVHAEQLSLMGLTEVISSLPRVLRILKQTKGLIRTYRPRCLVLIDAPDFNFRLVKLAFRLNIPVYYYISPQIWAWRQGRVRFLRRYVRKIFCIFPFEQEFYSRHDVPAYYVGHPLLQQLGHDPAPKIDHKQLNIGLMPGSRKKEISSLLPEFDKTALIIRDRFPNASFLIFKSSNIDKDYLTGFLDSDIDYKIIEYEHRYPEIASCTLIITASGTASLEAALLRTPAIVAYKVSLASYWIARLFIKVPFISMPNLILKKEVFPEFIQGRARASLLAEQTIAWLDSPQRLKEIGRDLDRIRHRLGQENASEKTSRLILDKATASLPQKDLEGQL